jgi:hypothetical protein
MAFYIITGNLGAGKSTVAVSIIREYLNENRSVATNLNLTIENLINENAKKTKCYRLPDVPTEVDFEVIGKGYEGDFKGDKSNGAIVLDECAKWLNSRSYNQPGRKGLINFFIHARKMRWDVYLLIQHIDALDKQFRDLFCEYQLHCTRMDRFNVPFVSKIYKSLFGKPLPLPRVHVGSLFYFTANGRHHVENRYYRGNDVFNGFDTEQVFSEFTGQTATSTYLTPYLIKGRYRNAKDRLNEALQNSSIASFFLIGIVLGVLGVNLLSPDGNSPDRGNWVCNADWESLFGDCSLSKQDVKKIIAQHKNKQSGDSEVSASGVYPLEAETEDESDKEVEKDNFQLNALVNNRVNPYVAVTNNGNKVDLTPYYVKITSPHSVQLTHKLTKEVIELKI